MPKKYIRVREHLRHVNNLVIIVRAHISKNPNYKEIKMSNNKNTASAESVEQEHPRDLTAKKESRPTQVNVNIWEADSHYLASFNHQSRRVFHNVEELLMAIEVEVKRLGA